MSEEKKCVECTDCNPSHANSDGTCACGCECCKKDEATA